LAFFVWVERNMALPWVGTWIQWPWVFLDGRVATSVVFDLFLVLALGSLTAFVARRRPRVVSLGVAAACAFVTMATWQPTGVILVQFVRSAVMGSIISFGAYWMILAYAAATYPRRSSALVLAAGIVTPMLSLDRLVLVVGAGAVFALTSYFRSPRSPSEPRST
jgi:hypothetical protein